MSRNRIPPNDPWYFNRWAFQQTTGNSTRKSVLSMLAMMADMNTGRCEARQETLALGAECGERAVRGHLKTLEDMGIIARRAQFRRDRGRRGDEFLMLAPGIVEWPDGELVPPRQNLPGEQPSGTMDTPPPVPELAAQERPPEERPLKEGRNARTSEPKKKVPLPADFPGELRPHLEAVYRILNDLATRHAALDVNPNALAQILMANRRKPLVHEAHECAGHWEDKGPRNVVACYRNWLKRAPNLAAIEPLDADGRTTAATGAHPPGVTPLRRDRPRGEAPVALTGDMTRFGRDDAPF